MAQIERIDNSRIPKRLHALFGR